MFQPCHHVPFRGRQDEDPEDDDQGMAVGIDRRLLCRSTVGSFADQPSALLLINRRLDHL
jgi:hypothetical protein